MEKASFIRCSLKYGVVIVGRAVKRDAAFGKSISWVTQQLVLKVLTTVQ